MVNVYLQTEVLFFWTAHLKIVHRISLICTTYTKMSEAHRVESSYIRFCLHFHRI